MSTLNGLTTSASRGLFQIIFGIIVVPLLIFVATQLQQIQVTSAIQAEQIKGIRSQLSTIVTSPRYTQREAAADFRLRDQLLRSLTDRIKTMEIDMMRDEE